MTFARDLHGAALEVPELLSLPAALMKYVAPAARAGDGRPATSQPARRQAKRAAEAADLMLRVIFAAGCIRRI
ncbi:hypothetical protein NicSoilB8_26500 [Arthrobacter sp. NicSoilB8]|nr:hypothetical protein NicSoilB8_26500 [Arthrobacter sp. NicSoilB8]